MNEIKSDRDIIGIDFGTTYSCVGVWKNNQVEIITNDLGNRITPSFVTFTDKEILVGDLAKEQSAINFKNTLFDSKRLFGRSICDEEVIEDKKNWPFEIQEHNGNLVYKVNINKEEIIYTPEEVASYIIAYMKKIAEDFLGRVVKDAVITVPAYFNNSQRQSTINAGSKSGLNVLALLNEPTAAALAYGFNNHLEKKRKVLIYDLGGGTFDVSLLNITGTNFEVLATTGNTRLGGVDFDQKLVNHFKKEFQEKTSIDISNCPQAISRLRVRSEKVKKALSSQNNVSINIDFLCKFEDFESSINNSKLSELCKDLFLLSIKYLDTLLKDAKVSKDKVDEIVLVGGSTRISKIQEILSEYFCGKPIKRSVNPDEAVAYGAAIYAKKLSNSLSESIKHLTLVDVTPLSLGIETTGGVMQYVIPRNSLLPIKVTKKFETSFDYQKELLFQVYEGENKISKLNHFLGKFYLRGIPIEKKGVAQVDVTFTLDNNGILNVKAYDIINKNTTQLDIDFS